MSKEDLNSLKEEIFLSIRQLEQKFSETLTVKTAQLSEEYEKYNEKLDFIINNNRSMIESVVSEKINIEKLNALESFKNKADGILISHEIRINNNNKTIGEMKTKYDRAIEDNLIVPGFIGPKCQYCNMKEYITANNSDMARLKYEKDQLKAETKHFKSRFDGLFKQMISIVDSSIDRSKDYTNGKILENKKQFDAKIDQFKERADEIRIEIQQIKTDIESQVNDLKLETQKINNFTEKSKIVDSNINKINNTLMKVNYEINKLYEKNKNSEKKIFDLKNDLARIKVMTEIRNKARNKPNNLKMNQITENNYTMENIRKERNNIEYIKEKNFSEKKNMNENRKKYFDIKEKKFGLNYLNREEMEIKNYNNKNYNKNRSKNNNKRLLKEDKKNRIRLNPFTKQIMNNKNNNDINNDYDINNEEKTETIISEESFEDNKDQNDFLNTKDYYKTANSINRIVSRNEDINDINPIFKETPVNNNTNFQSGFKTFKKPEIIRRRVSQIKFDAKTKSLKKVTYDITNENVFFPKINRQNPSKSVEKDYQVNYKNQNSPKENYINTNIDNNSATSESVNNNINKSNEVKIKINKDFEDNYNNNIIINERRDTINDNNEIEYSNMTSRKESNKSLNENSEKMSYLPSYRNSQKNLIENNDADIINNKNTYDKSPKLFSEDKYALDNFKKGKKRGNLPQMNNKKNFIGNINSNYMSNNNNYNSNINQLYLSERGFPQGINLVGLNDEKITRKNSIEGNTYIEQERENNLKLERLGIPSPNSQKPRIKNNKLQGISSEAPLKISAAFGRTAYTFINTNNNKKIYSIQMIKKKPENEKLDIYLGSNSSSQ